MTLRAMSLRHGPFFKTEEMHLMKKTTKVVLLILAACSVLAGCAITEPVDSGAVIVPVVPVKPAQESVPAPAPEQKLETNGLEAAYKIEAGGLDYFVFILSPTQVALKYPDGIRFEDISSAVPAFSAKYSDLVRDAVLAIDEENQMAVLTFSAALNETTLKDLEKDLREFIPSYIESYLANSPAAEPVEIKVPESKAVPQPVKTTAPAITPASAETPSTAPAASTQASAPASVATAAPAATPAPAVTAPAKSNAGTIILIVVLVIIAVSCTVYFINRRKQK